MSSRAAFAESAGRIAALHGGDEYAITLRDDTVVVNPATGAITSVAPDGWSAACTMPVTIAPSLVDGERVLSTDLVVFVQGDLAAIDIELEPGQLVTVTGPYMGDDGKQFVIGPRGAMRHAGALEIHLTAGTPEPASA